MDEILSGTTLKYEDLLKVEYNDIKRDWVTRFKCFDKMDRSRSKKDPIQVEFFSAPRASPISAGGFGAPLGAACLEKITANMDIIAAFGLLIQKLTINFALLVGNENALN